MEKAEAIMQKMQKIKEYTFMEALMLEIMENFSMTTLHLKNCW